MAAVPPSFAGREREQALLGARLDAAFAGHGGVVLIGGEAGIGKTALAEVLCGEASRRGALVLVGRCYDLTETPPYGPWVELFAHDPDTEYSPPLPVAFAERGTIGAIGSPAALSRQVREYFAGLSAHRPVVLLLDDLHWSDPASVDLLRVLARECATMPLLALVAYRADELTRRHPLGAALPLLMREADAVRLDLAPLDAAAIRALIAGRYDLQESDAARLAAYLHERGEGNALFIGELLRSLEESGALGREGDRWTLDALARMPVPTALRQVIDGRLDRLDDETRRLLEIAAVIGQEVLYALWGTVAEASEESLFAAVERAGGARVMEETADGAAARFTHALIREALYEGVRPSRRRGWHRQAGEALLAMPRPDPDAVAYHFERAGDPRAFAWLVRAGVRARRSAAWLTAAARFAAAAALPDEDSADVCGWLSFCSGNMLIFSDHVQGLRALDAAELLAAAAGDRALAAYVRIHRSQHLFNVGEVRRAITDLERGMADLDDLPDAYRLRGGVEVALERIATLLPDDEGAALVAPQGRAAPPVGIYGAYAAHWRTQSGRYREGLALCESFIAALAAVPEDARLEWGRPAYLGLGHAHAALGRPEAARRAYALSHAASYASNNWYMVAITRWCELVYVTLPYHADDPAGRARLVAEAGSAWERARGTITHNLHDDPTDLFPSLVEGRWGAAERLARGTLAAVTAAHSQGAIHVLGVLARYRGDPERAWERIHALYPAGPATEPGDCYFVHGIDVQALAAELALDAGDLGTAADWIAAHGRWLAWSGATLWRAGHLLLEARYARAMGEWERAWEHAAAARRQASELHQPLALLAAHRLLGELATETGRSEEAAAHLAASLALADACAAPFERALTLLALAELHAVTRDGARAAEYVAEARSICTPLDAKLALARADALSARLAARAAEPPAYPAGLSAREVEVLRLVAQGMSNREIADTLFLSPATVNVHVTHILTKTNTDNRTAAALFAREHGLA